MLTTPKIEQHAEQHYAAISERVSMEEIPVKLPPLIGQVHEWLQQRKIESVGPPFFRYRSMKNNQMLVDVGWPVQKKIDGDGRVEAGYFPEGRYVSVTHIGPYMKLNSAHMELEKYAKEHNLREKATQKDGEWGSRAEIYPTDPVKEPNSEKWETIIQFLLED